MTKQRKKRATKKGSATATPDKSTQESFEEGHDSGDEASGTVRLVVPACLLLLVVEFVSLIRAHLAILLVPGHHGPASIIDAFFSFVSS
jgi:hypothetical protein